MKEKICKIFGHKYTYYIIDNSPKKYIRVCLRCGIAQEWKMGYDKLVWMTLVQYTKFGAKDWMKKNNVRGN